jgi:hypothetical protein
MPPRVYRPDSLQVRGGCARARVRQPTAGVGSALGWLELGHSVSRSADQSLSADLSTM